MTELGFLAACIIGFLGSVHCIGMCGGIVGVLSGAGTHAPTWRQKYVYHLGYNTGRITSYAVAGYIAGSLGQNTLLVFSEERVQEIGLLISGGFLILMGLYLASWSQALQILERGGAVVWKRIQPLSQAHLPVNSFPRAVFLGMLWGWLPCGLVYATLVWAMFAADPLYSAFIMIAFGLGTLPTLLLMGNAATYINNFRRRLWVRRSAGAIIATFGVLTFLGVLQPLHGPAHPISDFCTTVKNDC